MKDKYIKPYREWNNLKEILDSVDIPLPFFEREIWSVCIGVNIGIEIDGKGDNFERPALIIKKFNKNHALILPITRTGEPHKSIHIPLSHKNLDMRSVAIISQMQRISSHRLMHRIGILDIYQFMHVTEMIKKVLFS